MILAPMLVILEVMCEIAMPRLMASIVDVGIANSDMRYILRQGGIMLILAVGSLLTNGRFDQIFNTYSSPVYPVADTIDTYIFRETFTTGIMNFGYSTSIGVLKSVVGLFMIVTTNKIVTSAGEQGLL